MCGKVSVIMGVYNCEETLPAAIDSIINQTYDNWELIMCDDCSTDKTYSVAKSYAERFPDRIKVLKNDENMRLAFCLNRCLNVATGEFIARMDGDDLSHPERFERQIYFLKEHPDVDLVGTAMQRFNAQGYQDVVYGIDSPDRYTLRKAIPFCHATIMTYKRVYDALGGYTVSQRTMRAQDYDLWFRFFAYGFKGMNLREALYFVREDDNAIKRRTFKVRNNAFKTTVYGFNLLGYPKWWIIHPFITMILKSMVPAELYKFYRMYQANKVDENKL